MFFVANLETVTINGSSVYTSTHVPSHEAPAGVGSQPYFLRKYGSSVMQQLFVPICDPFCLSLCLLNALELACDFDVRRQS